jgi:hypothetical protein
MGQSAETVVTKASASAASNISLLIMGEISLFRL